MAMKAQRSGDFKSLSDTHKQMAIVLHAEGSYTDETKSRILAFYLDLCGISERPYVDGENVEAITEAAKAGSIGDRKLSDLYQSVIRADVTPAHAMTVAGSFRLFKMCLKGQWKKANRIVKNLRQNTGRIDGRDKNVKI